jgi:hypothetical protein
MRARQYLNLTIVLALVCGLAATMTANAVADSIGDLNLLSNQTVTASTIFNWGNYGWIQPPNVTDGAYDEFVFLDGDSNQQLVISGFTSPVGQIRLWNYGDRIPQTVTIESSTTNVTIPTWGAAWATASTLFETTLTPTPVSIVQSSGAETIISVSAPAGTRSLYFNFGDSGGTGMAVAEIQAFGTPEPSALVLLACGLTALLAYAWRAKRR